MHVGRATMERQEMEVPNTGDMRTPGGGWLVELEGDGKRKPDTVGSGS